MKVKLIPVSIAFLFLATGVATAQEPSLGSGKSLGAPQDQNTKLIPLAKPSDNGRVPISPDDLQKYVVSTRAGGVNLSDGDVASRSGEGDWKMLLVGDQLNTGDSVKTGANSRAEILLTPGSYLRLAANTEVKLDDTAYDSIKVGLVAGSIIVEAAPVEGVGEVLARVSTPKSRFKIVNAGVYRFDSGSSGGDRVLVEKGELAVNGTKITRMKAANVDGNVKPSLQAVNKNSLDSLDLWSQERAKLLMESNSTLQSPSVAGAQAPTFSFFSRSRYYENGCNGSWLFDPFLGGFTYLPTYDPFYMPYCAPFSSGYGYEYPIRGCRRPRHKHTPGAAKPSLARVAKDHKQTLAAVVKERGAHSQNRAFGGGTFHHGGSAHGGGGYVGGLGYGGGHFGGSGGATHSSAGGSSGGGHASSSSGGGGSAGGGHH
jgi:hypothetical protein